MPSPFPGMDPFLEDPGLWPDVHHALISELQAFLNQNLSKRYVARVEERVYLAEYDDDIDPIFRIPDLRNRVLFTLGMLAIYRLGGHIPTPGIDANQLELSIKAHTRFGHQVRRR